MFTLRIFCLSKEGAWLFAIHNWSVDRRDISRTMSEVAFELVDVVGTLSASTGVLTVYGIHPHPPRANAHDKGILYISTSGCRRM